MWWMRDASGWCIWDASQPEPGHSGSGDGVLFISQRLLFLSWTMEGTLVGWRMLYIESKYLIFQNILNSYWGNTWSVPSSLWPVHSFISLYVIWIWHLYSCFTYKTLRNSDVQIQLLLAEGRILMNSIAYTLQLFLRLSLSLSFPPPSFGKTPEHWKYSKYSFSPSHPSVQ